ncbi:MAG: hypothetical protein V3S48_05720 [Candidatus Neomarinimicrobiota bacterium]
MNSKKIISLIVLLVFTATSAAPLLSGPEGCATNTCAMPETPSCCVPELDTDCNMSSAVLFVPIVTAPLNKIENERIAVIQSLMADQTILGPQFWAAPQLTADPGHAPPSAFSAPLRL